MTATDILCPSGIYAITNTVNGKKYIGSSIQLSKRLKAHWYLLSNGKHANAHLLSAWNTYKPEAFTFQILLVCEKSDLLFYEQRFIDYFDTFNSGYNLRPVAASNAGVKKSPESIKRTADSNRGRVHSEEEKLKRAKSCTGLKRSAETLERMSIAQTGKKMSEAARAKMSARVYTQAQRDHMRRIKTGTVASPETKAKMSLAQQRRIAARRLQNELI